MQSALKPYHTRQGEFQSTKENLPDGSVRYGVKRLRSRPEVLVDELLDLGLSYDELTVLIARRKIGRNPVQQS